MSSRALSGRWQDASGAALAAQVLERLLAGEPLDGLPLDRYDGRVDLRGFVVPSPEVLGVGGVTEERAGEERPGLGMQWLGGLIEFRTVPLTNLDLTGAHLDNLRFFDATLRNCRFDKAKCRDWRGWNLTVDDCSFRGATLRGSALGTWHDGKGNHYRAVNFTGADLRDIGCQGASFLDCEFSGTRLDKVEFGGCEFTDCRFEGVLDSVRFLAEPMFGIDKTEPGSMRNVDLSRTTLRRTEFHGLPLDQVTLPPEGDEHVIVHHYPCVVRHMVSQLEDNFGPDTQTLFARMLANASQLDESRDIGIWHRDELGETRQQQDLARELLHEAERNCTN